MRKKSIILMLAIAGIFASCNDAIDIDQDGQVTNPAVVYTNAGEVARGVSGVYSYLPGRNEIEFVSTYTDELALGIDNGGQGLIRGEYGFFMQPGNSYAQSIWGNYYSVLNRINRMLAETDRLIATNPGAAEMGSLRKSKVELLVLRAYCNYKLFAYYTPDYTNPSGLSIMKFDFLQTDNLDHVVGRSTVSEIKDFIIGDLDDAQDILDSGNSVDTFGDASFVRPLLINVIKTKLYSLVEDHNNTILYGELVLQDPSNRLATAAQYVSYFGDTQISREVLFQLKRSFGSAAIPALESVAASWYSINVSSTGSAFYEMGRSLYNAFDELDGASTGLDVSASRTDVRYSVNLLDGSEVATDYQTLPLADYKDKDILLVGKYKGRPSQGRPLQNDIPIFRSADIYLAIAEARALQGIYTSTPLNANNASVESIILTIRRSRSTDPANVTMPVINSAQSAWKAILDERRVEFAFEGHRYLDMKRLGAKAGSPGFERYEKDCAINGACVLPITDYRMTLPIPTTELNANSIIRGQQNPGY